MDYVKVFKTPDELVDFLMLDNAGQQKVLEEMAKSGKLEGEMNCSLHGHTPKSKQQKCRQ